MVVIRDRDAVYGVAVERFVGERTLVVVPLDPRLGKVQDVSAGALLDDGTPVLILDVEDLLRSVEKLLATGRLERIDPAGRLAGPARKRVLVVDDSLTVRELERKLLLGRGYDVAVAVDGMDGWNALRSEHFDLVITDIDMPRMDGIELVTLIRRDTRLQSLPVMVVSYKDREEDRRRGLDAGADYYLAKASFHDEALLDAVVDLIGECAGMKIGIVNDMPLAVEALRRALAFEPAHRVVWVAANGAEAVEMCAAQTPDVILMDLLMPVMDGVEATRRIMAQSPCAIIVVTVDLEQNMSRVFDAMGNGAVDAVNTPAMGSGDPAEAARPLLRKLQNLAWLNAPLDSRPTASAAPARKGSGARKRWWRSALRRAARRRWPTCSPVCRRISRRPWCWSSMSTRCSPPAWPSGSRRPANRRLPVRLARNGEPPQPGCVLLAGTNHHIRLVKGGELAYTAQPSGHVYRPSIDVFFDSVVEYWRGDAVGVLLTGMGRDGAEGLKRMRERGFLTLAQDQASSAVYGMPKAAAAIGAAVEIRALGDIARRLAEVCA